MMFMKKTRDKRLFNFFKSKKFNEKEFKTDKNSLISTFNEQGYRDARILKDTMYYISPDRLQIDFKFDQGDKYHFRNITWGLMAASEKSGRPLFAGSYPITPATAILEELAVHKELGVVTMQCEDEIAGICTSIGAAYAGSMKVAHAMLDQGVI